MSTTSISDLEKVNWQKLKDNDAERVPVSKHARKEIARLFSGIV